MTHRAKLGIRRWRRRLLSCLLLLLLTSAGCATYSDRVRAVREETAAGNFEAAIKRLNKLLKVDSNTELPSRFGDDTGLLLLERGALQQAVEDFQPSSQDLVTADREIQFLDISNDAVGNIGRYVYSDSAAKFQAYPTEKLSINAFNMLNFLALGDLRGARVEARRFTVMREYLQNFDPRAPHGAFGSYVAGFVFERLAEWGSSMRYYDEALQERDFTSLRRPIRRVARLTPFRGRRIDGFLSRTPDPGPIPAGIPSEIIVIASVGRVPQKFPERMPIGAAVGMAGTFISGNASVLKYSAFKFINYPELVDVPSVHQSANLTIDGRPAGFELATNIGAAVRREYEAIKPQIIGAAVSRMIVRAAVAEGARAAGNQSSSGLGTAIALIAEAAMVAADRPDTRSWGSLPNRVFVHRSEVTPGRHTVVVDLPGADPAQRIFELDIPAEGFAAIVVTSPR